MILTILFMAPVLSADEQLEFVKPYSIKIFKVKAGHLLNFQFYVDKNIDDYRILNDSIGISRDSGRKRINLFVDHHVLPANTQSLFENKSHLKNEDEVKRISREIFKFIKNKNLLLIDLNQSQRLPASQN